MSETKLDQVRELIAGLRFNDNGEEIGRIIAARMVAVLEDAIAAPSSGPREQDPLEMEAFAAAIKWCVALGDCSYEHFLPRWQEERRRRWLGSEPERDPAGYAATHPKREGAFGELPDVPGSTVVVTRN